MSARVVVLGLVMILLTGCGGGSTQVSVVAGGGDDREATRASEIQLEGHALDMAVGDGVVYVLALPEAGEQYVIAAAGDEVTHIDVGTATELSYLAAGAAGAAYAADTDVIYRVDQGSLEPVVEAQEGGRIRGLAVGGDGEPIWSESFLGTGPEGEDMLLVRVQRLARGWVERVAGVDESDAEPEQVRAWQQAPPDDVAAPDLPLRDAGADGIAADDDGTVYLAGGDGVILRVSPDGSVDAITGAGDRAVPDEPYADDGDAAEFGGQWSRGDIDVSGGRVVVVDSSLVHEPVDVEPFDWTGDMFDGARQVADTIVRRPRADGSFDLDLSSTALEGLAVLVQDGSAATVAAHVATVAIDGETLYMAGQTREIAQSGDDAEVLVVSTTLDHD